MDNGRWSNRIPTLEYKSLQGLPPASGVLAYGTRLSVSSVLASRSSRSRSKELKSSGCYRQLYIVQPWRPEVGGNSGLGQAAVSQV